MNACIITAIPIVIRCQYILINWIVRPDLLPSIHFMSCGPVMGRWLIQISEWIQPKHILEIGTFTGYSALCLAQGLQSDGIITCLEVNEEYESIIRKYFAIAENRIN